MLLMHNNTDRKIYIKYYLKAKQIKKQDLDEIIEDLYYIDAIGISWEEMKKRYLKEVGR